MMDKVIVSSEDALRLIAKSIEMGKYDNALAILNDIGKAINKVSEENIALKERLAVAEEYLWRCKNYVERCWLSNPEWWEREIQPFLSHAPTDYVAVRRDDLETILLAMKHNLLPSDPIADRLKAALEKP